MSTFQINTNIGALDAYNALNKANSEGMKAQLRLASRKRINSVADDVSGYNVGKSLDSKVQLMKSAQNNIGAAKNMLSTAESALQQVKDKLTQIRSYVADATDPTKDRTALADNIKSLGQEIANIMYSTKFNNTQLLSGTAALSSVGSGGVGTSANLGSLANSFTFQTGADSFDRINLDFASGLASTGSTAITNSGFSLSVTSDIATALNSFVSLTTTDDATSAQEIANLASVTTMTSGQADISSSIGKFEKLVSDALGKIGNFQQRLDVKDEYLTSAISNAQSSVSRLFDADMAMEQLNATKAQIGSQVATSMLSQLNSAPQNILQLFK
ncbi:MAG: flagellar biosynthesis protein FliC [Ignavibacteria bacterium]|jgi:flagellin|nr:flagellar biosynthesis protein FliC [Ignavibacteria bacterium]MCU7502561.1 flagellar biosynthesis protein FliC [Ignavibacteria bacterium]MCU7515236.1 flagellar biosynthesis protein FliC [Ignavibacteria bacterium]